VRSVTKSVISLLFGIAMADHAIVSLDSPVLDYFPEYKDLQTSERRKIRLRDLLPMTSGLHWDEWSNLYGDIRNSETAMDLAADAGEIHVPTSKPHCLFADAIFPREPSGRCDSVLRASRGQKANQKK